MTAVTIYAHHVIEQRSERLVAVAHAAVATDGAHKPLVVKGAVLASCEDAAAFELTAAYGVLRKLNQPCDVTVVLKPEVLAQIQPGVKHTLMVQHHLAALKAKAERCMHRLTFAALDGQPGASDFQTQALDAALAVTEEWREDAAGDRADRSQEAAVG